MSFFPDKLNAKIERLLHRLSRSGPFSLVFALAFSILTILTVSRLLLLLVQFKRVQSEPLFLLTFPLGLRMDMILVSYFTILPTLLALILPKSYLSKIKYAIFGYLSLSLSTVYFMEVSTFSFMEEYDRRPDNLFIDYLGSPREVFGTLFADYKLDLFIGFAGMALVFFLAWKLFSRLFDLYQDWPWKSRLKAFPLAAILLFIFARSSFGHKPANISSASFSDNHIINEITLNSSYTLLKAMYRIYISEKNPSKIYGEMKRAEIFKRVRRHAIIPESDYVDSDVPFAHRQSSPFKRNRPLNVVIVLEESFGSRFVGALGGQPLSPNIDALSDESLFFTNLRSTGTRTVRGIESVVAGFLPTPGRSVIKIDFSNRDFFTIGSLLKSHGYATEFHYGGSGKFDQMGAFLSGNGFDKIYDETTFKNPEFRSVWGVSDEDLFRRAHKSFIAHGDQPFFALLLTTSNHPPFRFPAGKIELYEQPQATRYNAMKYADYAIGKFIAMAKTAPYYKNTIFLFVADHDTRVKGKELVPIERFRILGMIIGPGVPKMKFNKLCSQVDLLPTLLHFIGLTTIHPMLGRNLMTLPDDVRGHAFMQFSDHNAYQIGNDVVIMLPGQKPRQFRCVDHDLEPAALDEEMARDALAHSLLPWMLYKKREYRLP